MKWLKRHLRELVIPGLAVIWIAGSSHLSDKWKAVFGLMLFVLIGIMGLISGPAAMDAGTVKAQKRIFGYEVTMPIEELGKRARAGWLVAVLVGAAAIAYLILGR